MNLTADQEQLFGHLNILTNSTYDLKSKITVIRLYVEQSNLAESYKNSIIDICDTVHEKLEELIFVEEQLKNVTSILTE